MSESDWKRKTKTAEIYRLTDLGLDNATIAERVGTTVNCVCVTKWRRKPGNADKVRRWQRDYVRRRTMEERS